MHKRGQGKGSAAATLVGIITLVIIFYILFLPPAERADLLGEPSTVTTNPRYGSQNPDAPPPIELGIIVSEHIGSLSPYEDIEPILLPDVYVAETTNAEVLERFSPITVQSGLFNTKYAAASVTFTLDDLTTVENALLSFTAKKHKGILSITLNGEQIYAYAITSLNPDPIKLDQSLLKKQNALTFSVAPVGASFWKTNEYALENIMITGDVTDLSRQQSTSKFFIVESDYENLEQAVLRFIPYCASLNSVGLLEIFLNNKNIFSAVPICDDPYKLSFSPRALNPDQNTLTFVTSKGSYSVEQVRIDLEAKPIKSKILYFELDPELFLGFEEVVSKVECGVVDGLCPEFCDEDRDIDCCFAESPNTYWCDLEPDDADDRCVSAVDSAKCARCPTGYEDEKGNPPDACEEQCGDDTDDACPAGCDINYDEDCCFMENEDNYWCDDLPVTGLSSVCEAAITSGECDDCPFGYRSKTNTKLTCDTGLQPYLVEELDVLREGYSVVLYIEFVDDGKNKDADIVVNGRRFNIDQDRPYYSRDISEWVRAQTNYIEVYPVSPLEIVKLEVRIE
ncbi:hypothetical protein J4464_01785 [Candidatus Woesearchaeota archaeon]|nr:hypothetical protein [Candidatus Woesearchaeota archaeon]